MEEKEKEARSSRFAAAAMRGIEAHRKWAADSEMWKRLLTQAASEVGQVLGVRLIFYFGPDGENLMVQNVDSLATAPLIKVRARPGEPLSFGWVKPIVPYWEELCTEQKVAEALEKLLSLPDTVEVILDVAGEDVRRRRSLAAMSKREKASHEDLFEADIAGRG